MSVEYIYKNHVHIHENNMNMRWTSQYEGALSQYGEMGVPREFCTHAAEVRFTVGRGQPVCLGIAYICFVPRWLPVIKGDPSTNLKNHWFLGHHLNVAIKIYEKEIIHVQNLKGYCKKNIDKAGNVFHWGLFLVSQHNLLEVPSGGIKINNAEALGDHWKCNAMKSSHKVF